MTIYEEYAERIIIFTYNKGGIIDHKDIQSELHVPKEQLDGVDFLLKIYGEFKGYNYQLSEKGAEFARLGAFSGVERRLVAERKRNKQTRNIAIAGCVLAGITALTQFVMMLVHFW